MAWELVVLVKVRVRVFEGGVEVVGGGVLLGFVWVGWRCVLCR